MMPGPPVGQRRYTPAFVSAVRIREQMWEGKAVTLTLEGRNVVMSETTRQQLELVELGARVSNYPKAVDHRRLRDTIEGDAVAATGLMYRPFIDYLEALIP